MSKDEFLSWITKQEKAVKVYLDQGLSQEAASLAEEALEKLAKAEDLAKKEGIVEIWQEKEQFFRKLVDEAVELQKKFDDEESEPELEKTWGVDGMSAQGLFARGEALFDVGEYKKALKDLQTAFEEGVKDYSISFLILECMNKQGKLEEQIAFMNRALEEAELSDNETAKLYYRLALIHLHFDKKDEAKKALWQVRKLDPTFPGLEEKLKPLEVKKETKSKNRYDLLIKNGAIDQDTVDAVMKDAQERNADPDQVIMGDHGVSKEDLGASLSEYFNVEFVPFDPAFEPPFELFEKKKLDPEFLKKSKWVPFATEGRTIEILMANPYDFDRLGEIKFLFETNNVLAKVALAEDIEQFIEHFYRGMSGDQELSALGEDLDIDDSFDDDLSVGAGEEEELTEGDSEVVRLVNALLVEAWRRNVSDIHIEPNPRSRYTMIRFREDGTCHEFKKIRYTLSRPLVSRIKIMATLDIAERRLPQDGKVKIKLPDRNQVVEYRVATVPTVDSQEDIVLRVLASGKPLPLGKLGLLEKSLEAFQECVYTPYGLVLVVGPTGSGKTTTLHSALSYINKPERKIWTAEDPVEITQEGLRQVQVKPDIGLTFPACMRSFLRADPDVIMIGEMRDEETAHIGIEASLTGHLVFSTLHTNSAPETITRLLDMKIDPFNFADSLLCVLAQRLMKTLCDKCKEEYKPKPEEVKALDNEFGGGLAKKAKEYVGVDITKMTLFKPKGCSVCNKGYKGRLGVHELMVNTPAMKPMIKFKKPTEEIREEAIKNGMLTLKQDGMMKVLTGLTDMVQVRAVATM